jgi:BASS family bile acid:Na+ symporter
VKCHRKFVFLALLASFVLMPLATFAIERLLHLDPALANGLLLLGTAAGSPFLPKLAGIAKANLATAVSLMVLLMMVTVVYMPLVLPLLLEGVSVDPMKIARSLVLFMLLPLAVGLAVKARFDRAAARAKPLLDPVSTVSLVLLIVLVVVVNFGKVMEIFGTRGILAGIIFIVLGYGLGQFLGGPGLDTRRVLALGTAQRNIAASLVVGGQNFSNPTVVVMLVVVAIVGFLILIPLARVLGKRSSEQPA